MTFTPHHVGLTVPDLEKAVQWYTSVLGFDVATELTVPDTGLQIAMLVKDGFRLELFAHPESSRHEPAYSDIALHLPNEGWRHLAFTVADLPQTLNETINKGATFAGGPVKNDALGFTLCVRRPTRSAI